VKSEGWNLRTTEQGLPYLASLPRVRRNRMSFPSGHFPLHLSLFTLQTSRFPPSAGRTPSLWAAQRPIAQRPRGREVVQGGRRAGFNGSSDESRVEDLIPVLPGPAFRTWRKPQTRRESLGFRFCSLCSLPELRAIVVPGDMRVNVISADSRQGGASVSGGRS
jgi:hypothetical protein